MSEPKRINIADESLQLCAMLDLVTYIDLYELRDEHESLYGMEIFLKFVAEKARVLRTAIETQGGGQYA
ncbi:MAG: hypothetical protein PWQ57_1223 [Desulfovibrionales bacterium]|jgi:hypothetical protein|nr:hypothetical protein [Desulfovibrionales bacterium]